MSCQAVVKVALLFSLCQVALACARLGQLLVWDWRAETYVLKQQGHYYDVAAVAYSPDGALLASGADDSKVLLCRQCRMNWRPPVKLLACHMQCQ
jgi:WD40 repeat protein